MAEISDQELAVLNGSKKLLDSMLKNPKTARETQKLVKTLYPDTVTQDDIAEPYLAEVRESRKELQDFIKSQQEKEIDSRLNREFDILRSEHFTDEGIETIKKVMVAKQIKSPLDAAKVWRADNPPAPQQPAGFQPTSWGFGADSADADVAALFKNEDSWADKTAQETWQQVKSGQVLT